MKIDRIKTGGRIKGTPNKITSETRELLFVIVNNEIENLPMILAQLEPRERVYVLTKLLPFVFPKVTEDHKTGSEPVIICIPDNI
jgi:hypothetical protein